MAAAGRSVLLYLRATLNNSTRRSGSFPFSRFLSSGPLTSESSEESSQQNDLRSKIFSLQLPKPGAMNVIQRWISEGNQTNISELRQILIELRNSQRYKHALEISEWMSSHGEFVLSDSDYATRIDLMIKVSGIDAAETYFESLPDSAKTSKSYTVLLHSYARAKLTEKAEELYRRIKDSKLLFSALAYNEMMTLYMSVGQMEKVAAVVEDLKQNNVAPDLFTYNAWISSCVVTRKIDEVRKILDEMSRDPGFNDGWSRYSSLVKIYIAAGDLVNSWDSPVVETDKSIILDFLIILNAGLGDKDGIDQIWKSVRMTKQKLPSRHYICIMSSYLVLGHLKEMKEVMEEWKLIQNA